MYLVEDLTGDPAWPTQSPDLVTWIAWELGIEVIDLVSQITFIYLLQLWFS